MQGLRLLQQETDCRSGGVIRCHDAEKIGLRAGFLFTDTEGPIGGRTSLIEQIVNFPLFLCQIDTIKAVLLHARTLFCATVEPGPDENEAKGDERFMKKSRICHKQNNDFLDALHSCLTSGLSVWFDGIPFTGDRLPDSLLLKEDAEWEGTFLKDERGTLRGISFTDIKLR